MNPDQGNAADIEERRIENRRFLREAVERGQIADFSRRTTVESLSDEDKEAGLTAKPLETIDSAYIRELLTGVAPGGVALNGVRLFKVTITGQLDLDDATGPGGAPMPRLELTQCWFAEGQMRMERSRMQSLCVRGCRFTELQAAEAVIEGPIDISRALTAEIDECGKARDEGRCWVVFAGARIGGRINAARSRFRAPPKRDPDEWVLYSKHARYALDLRGTHIQGSVNLRPYVTAVGGVCLTLARMDGSLWANGAYFEALEEWAFAADYAQVQGSLYFRPYDMPERISGDAVRTLEASDLAAKSGEVAQSIEFRAKGCMSLFAAKIGGSLFFDGAKLRAHTPMDRDTRTEKKTVLNASTAVIGGYCLFKGWISEQVKDDATTVDPKLVSHFVGDGAVILTAATVGNDLDFSGARVRSVHANNIKVSGNCVLSTYSMPKVEWRQPFLATYAVHFEGATIRGNFVMNEARIGSLHVAETELLEQLDASLPVIEASEMHRRFDKRNLGVDGPGRMEFADRRNGVFAEGITIDGKCSMGISDEAETKYRFECAGRISMQEARLNNSLRMDGAWVVGPEDRTTIDLSGIHVGGKATFMTWDKSKTNLGRAFMLWGGQIGLKLTSAKIGQELLMNGASIRGSGTALTAKNIDVGGKATLGTYEDNKLSQHHLFNFRAFGKVNLVSATIKLGLDMSGAELYGVALKPNEVLNSSNDALDLTRLHAKYVRLKTHHHCVKGDHHVYGAWQDFKATGKVRLDHAEIATYLSIEGAEFNHELSAEFAKVGGAVLLKQARFTSGFARRGCTEAMAREQHRQQKKGADLSFRGISIGGSLVVGVPADDQEDGSQDIDWRLQLLPCDVIKPGAMKPGAMRLGGIKPGEKPEGRLAERPLPFTVDLRGAHVAELDDLGGRGWGRDVLLWLEGFRYLRLPVSANVPEVKKDWRFYIRRAVDPSSITETAATGEVAPLQTKSRSGLWVERALWLKRQYFDERDIKAYGFSPDVYEQVVRAMNQAGAYEDARHIASLRLTLPNPQNQLGRSIAMVPLRVLFDYGLSVRRAVMTFLVFVAIGSVAARVANYGFWGAGRVLILNVSPPDSKLHYVTAGHDTPERTEILPSKDDTEDTATGVAGSSDFYPEEVPCGDHAGSLLYALDVFVPVLDLRQQESCSIAPSHPYWRLAQALYAVLGWVITSLLILTCSGLLRRHLEK